MRVYALMVSCDIYFFNLLCIVSYVGYWHVIVYIHIDVISTPYTYIDGRKFVYSIWINLDLLAIEAVKILTLAFMHLVSLIVYNFFILITGGPLNRYRANWFIVSCIIIIIIYIYIDMY